MGVGEKRALCQEESNPRTRRRLFAPPMQNFMGWSPDEIATLREHEPASTTSDQPGDKPRDIENDCGWSSDEVAMFLEDGDCYEAAPVTSHESERKPRFAMEQGSGSTGLDQSGWSHEEIALFLKDNEGTSVTQGPIAREQPNVFPLANAHSQALGALDFRKRFLISCIIGDETILTPQQISQLADVPDIRCESYLRSVHRVDTKVLPPTKKLAPRFGMACVFSCYVGSDGERFFKTPTFEDEKMPLQRAFGDDKVLQVNFCTGNRNSAAKFRMIVREGIQVGLRHFDYFVDKEEKKSKKTSSAKQDRKIRSFFVCTKSFAARDISDPHFSKFKSSEECRLFMMHIHTVSSIPLYSKRLQLALSKTSESGINMSEVNVRQIEDIPCRDENQEVVRDSSGKQLIHTDGTGLISEDLARKCRAIDDKEEWPLLLQVRLLYHGMAIKGTLLATNTLPPKTLLYRDSMLKVAADPRLANIPTYDSLEICGTSQKPKTANLSRYVIALLTIGGVPGSVFIQAVKDAITKAERALHDLEAAAKLCRKYQEMADLEKRMIVAGIPLEDPYLHASLMRFIRMQMEAYAKAKVPLDESYYLMGTADPTGSLKRNQVAIILENGPLYRSKVLVYKHPGMHPGDIHIFEATWTQELEEFVGQGKYTIIFPIQGPRSVVDEIANSDLDGDRYWICTNEQVVKHFRASPPWQNPGPKLINVPKPSREVGDHLIDSFISAAFHPSFAVSTAATNWLVHMDRYLGLSDERTDEKRSLEGYLLELVDLYYAALDAEKTGETVKIEDHLIARTRPHFLKDNSYRCYNSTSIFGQIYDLVKHACEDEERQCINGFPEYSSRFKYGDYEQYIQYWEQHYREYREDMSAAMRGDASLKNGVADCINEKYRKLLYGGDGTWKKSSKSAYQVLEEACAIYSVVYEHARRNYERNWSYSFNFAWNTAGLPLCSLYSDEEEGEPYVVTEARMKILCR